MVQTKSIDWSNLEIVKAPDEWGRDVPMEDVEMFSLLRLRDEDERAEEMLHVDDVLAPTTNPEVPDDIPMHVNDVRQEVHHSYDMEYPNISIGTSYPTMKQFRLAIRQSAINEFILKIEKSDTTRFVAKCNADGCPWRILGRQTPDKTLIRVNALIDVHKCNSTSRIRSPMASQGWVALKAIKILRKKPNMTTKEMQDQLQEGYNMTIGYDTVYRGRARALEEIYGSWEASFQFLYNFKAEVELRDPGSIIEIGTKEVKGDVCFHRFFVSFKACVDGFLNSCRPYISIDATALNGKWNGYLAVVVALDGHNWMFPLAFGLIDGETRDNWAWFMIQLKREIGEPSILAICTDASKGLENAVKDAFPHAEQRKCFRHLMENFVMKFYGDIPNHVYPAARAYKPEVFEYHMCEVLAKCPAAADYLQRHHNLMWMRCNFNIAIKCDYINNNLAEQQLGEGIKGSSSCGTS